MNFLPFETSFRFVYDIITTWNMCSVFAAVFVVVFIEKSSLSAWWYRRISGRRRRRRRCFSGGEKYVCVRRLLLHCKAYTVLATLARTASKRTLNWPENELENHSLFSHYLRDSSQCSHASWSKLAQYPAILISGPQYRILNILFFPVNVIFFRGTKRRFPPKCIEKSFKAIQSTFRCLEMHSKRCYKSCICSVILGELEAFRNYKGFFFPENFRSNWTFYESEDFSYSSLSSITFLNPKILISLFYEN